MHAISGTSCMWYVSRDSQRQNPFARLFSPLRLPTERAICSANVFSVFIFNGPTYHPVISECTGPIFTKFSGSAWEGFINRSLILWPNLRNWSIPARSFGTLAFRNGLQDRNFHFRRLNDNDFSTLCRNLLRFRPAIPEFTKLECVQQASIIPGVTLTTFAMGSNWVCFTTVHQRETPLGRAGYTLGFDTHF